MFKRDKKDNKGFTLVELVIVIAILAILVGLLAPQYTKYVEKSRKAADASNMDEMVKVVKVFAADPANELPAAKYIIKISNVAGTDTDITSDKSDKEITDGLTALKAEMGKSIPKWDKTVTKSKKWNEGKSSPIYAIVTVGEDGGTSVQYSLESTYKADSAFEKYMTTGSDETKTSSTSQTGSDAGNSEGSGDTGSKDTGSEG